MKRNKTSNLAAYLFELPHIGKRKAVDRLWVRLFFRYRSSTILRHERQILRILELATAENE